MIRSGFSSREAMFRMFGIHHGTLKGTSVLFAYYETDGLTSGEALVFLREVKTNKLLLVRGIHTAMPSGTMKGLLKGQWNPKEISPAVALKLFVCQENFRLTSILYRLAKQQRAFKTLQEQHAKQDKPLAVLKNIWDFVKKIRLY